MTHSLLDHLPWDSGFFGLSIASSRIEGDTVEAAVEAAAAESVECLYLFIPEARPAALTDALRRGGLLVDLRVRLDLDDRVTHVGGWRRAGPADLARLRPLARSLARTSRFDADPRFPKDSTRAMYEIWLERCLEEGVVVVPDRSLGGFVGARPSGEGLSVDLVYVHPRFRGRGLASRLVTGAIASMGRVRAHVVTQAWNIAAQRSYQDIGFRTGSLEAIVHLWLDRVPGRTGGDSSGRQ